MAMSTRIMPSCKGCHMRCQASVLAKLEINLKPLQHSFQAPFLIAPFTRTKASLHTRSGFIVCAGSLCVRGAPTYTFPDQWQAPPPTPFKLRFKRAKSHQPNIFTSDPHPGSKNGHCRASRDAACTRCPSGSSGRRRPDGTFCMCAP